MGQGGLLLRRHASTDHGSPSLLGSDDEEVHPEVPTHTGEAGHGAPEGAWGGTGRWTSAFWGLSTMPRRGEAGRPISSPAECASHGLPAKKRRSASTKTCSFLAAGMPVSISGERPKRPHPTMFRGTQSVASLPRHPTNEHEGVDVPLEERAFVWVNGDLASNPTGLTKSSRKEPYLALLPFLRIPAGAWMAEVHLHDLCGDRRAQDHRRRKLGKTGVESASHRRFARPYPLRIYKLRMTVLCRQVSC